MRTILIPLAFALLFPLDGHTAQNDTKDEGDYVKEWCSEHDGQREWLLDDKSEVDCLTDTHVVELKRASDWSELPKGIGQVIHYTQRIGLNRQPGLVLIVEDGTGCTNVRRLGKTLEGVSVKGSPVELLPSIGPYAEQCPQ